MVGKISGEDVWKVFQTNQDFREECLPLSTEERLVVKEFVLAMPDVLANMLDKPLDANVFFEAKMAVWSYQLEHDYCGKLTGIRARRDGYSEEERLNLAQNTELALISSIENRTRQHATDGGRIMNEKFFQQMLADCLAHAEKFRMGALTLADLLLSQPATLFCFIEFSWGEEDEYEVDLEDDEDEGEDDDPDQRGSC